MAGRANIGRLIHSPDRYMAGFKTLISAIQMNEEDYHLSLGSKIPVSIASEAGSDVRVLGIGSGSGQIDSIILKKILQRYNSVYSRIVEPSEEMIGQFKTLAREDKSLGAVKFDWRQQTAEEYFLAKDSTKFHLIHAVHVLYHVEDLHATLRNMWEQLADGGYMLITIKSGDWLKMRLKLWEDFGQGDRLQSSFRASSDVKQWFDTEGISYVTFEDEVKINVTECYKEDSEDGRMLLDFLTHTACVSSEPGIESLALEYIRRNKSVVDDKIFFKSIDEAIVAFKKGTGK